MENTVQIASFRQSAQPLTTCSSKLCAATEKPCDFFHEPASVLTKPHNLSIALPGVSGDGEKSETQSAWQTPDAARRNQAAQSLGYHHRRSHSDQPSGYSTVAFAPCEPYFLYEL
jgi:hypothetical protein